jgi:hypothetical protein
MRFSAFITICLLFLFSCSDEHSVPKGILPPPKMQVVMWDMIRAGEYQNNFLFLKDSSANKLERSLAFYDTVYRIHNITKDEFEKSYDYYRNHSELMKDLIDSLSKKDLDAETKTEQPSSPNAPPDTSTPGKIIRPGNKAGFRVADSLKKVLIEEKK